jgi:hypothetical protein
MGIFHQCLSVVRTRNFYRLLHASRVVTSISGGALWFLISRPFAASETVPYCTVLDSIAACYSIVELLHVVMALHGPFIESELLKRTWSSEVHTPYKCSTVQSALYCTVLYCTVLYCTVLYCTVPYCTDTSGSGAFRSRSPPNLISTEYSSTVQYRELYLLTTQTSIVPYYGVEKPQE